MKAKDLAEEIESALFDSEVEMTDEQTEWLERKFAHLKLKITDLQEVQDAHYNLWRLLKELK